MARGDADIPYGTLDLMVLKILDAMGPLNGYAVARRIEQIAQGSLALNQGTIYPALLRLEQKGWIQSEWGTSDNNRRARFYELTTNKPLYFTTKYELVYTDTDLPTHYAFKIGSKLDAIAKEYERVKNQSGPEKKEPAPAKGKPTAAQLTQVKAVLAALR